MKVPIQNGLVYVAEENDKIVGFAGLLNPIDIETEIKVFMFIPIINDRELDKKYLITLKKILFKMVVKN